MGNTFVCISSYFKGKEFLMECKSLGNTVFLITSESLKNEDWPWDSIDNVFYLEEEKPNTWNLDHLIQGFSHLMQQHKIDRVIALDDFDVEKAALVRETFRFPGMGQTTHRYFRDKLAMRVKAKEHEVNVPKFTAIFNNNEVENFANTVEAPWVLKPRSEASAAGIKKVHTKKELWELINELGKERHLFLLEQFKPGHVYHVDSIIYNSEIIFTSSSRYLAPPMQVSHEGGVFRTKTLDQNSKDAIALKEWNKKVLQSFGIVHGVSHTEFIQSKDTGEWIFLETSARVGGAFISDMVEAATDINLWKEWARLEHNLLNNNPYVLPNHKNGIAALLICLAKKQHPDIEPFKRDELVKSLPKDYHVALLYASNNDNILNEIIEESTELLLNKYTNIIPPTEKPIH